MNFFIRLFSVPELRARVLFTLFMMVIFSLGSTIVVPGINPVELRLFFDSLQAKGGGNRVLDFINLFTGGALKQFAVFALGVMPYISASIIMNLLQIAIPALETLTKEGGEYGRFQINRYTRLLAIGISVVESLGFLFYFKSQILVQSMNQGFNVLTIDHVGIMFSFIFVLIMTTGTLFLLWLGERVSEKGIGNGVSLIIFTGIVSSIPGTVVRLFRLSSESNGAANIKIVVLLLIFFMAMILVILLREGERRITIKYAKRVVGNRVYQGQNTYLPFKVDSSGVVAIIFASSILLFPSQLLGTFGVNNSLIQKIVVVLSPGHPVYYILYFFLIIFFCYFYTAIQYNPVEISNQIQKNGGFIPGIRPGSQTSTYLERILRRIIFPGAILVGLVALIPSIVSDLLGVPNSISRIFGGTTLMILVGVALDTIKQIEANLKTNMLKYKAGGR